MTIDQESADALARIHTIVADALGLDPERLALAEDTRLLGAMPELDSMAIVAIVTAIESDTGVRIEDDALRAETFTSLGSLSEFYRRQVSVHEGSSARDS